MHRKRIPGGEVLAGLDPPARSQPVRLEVEGQCELSRDRFCNSSTIICVHAVFFSVDDFSPGLCSCLLM